MNATLAEALAPDSFPPVARLRLDGDALVANWRALDRLSGDARAGAAVKADGYGLGAREVVRRLAAAGCRDFFVANWREATAIADLVEPQSIAVLNGVFADEIAAARGLGCVPVLNSAEQVVRWRAAGGGRCHVMLDSGMNRLGIDLARERLDFSGLDIDVVMSHLASADEQVLQNDAQRARFAAELAAVPARRRSLANSAGIALGSPFHFDLTRPGLALYGGVPCEALAAAIAPVAAVEARVVQARQIGPGDRVGYSGTFVADRPMRALVVAIGYADGYLRGFSNRGWAVADGARLPVLGRVSMDLLIVAGDAVPEVGEGDWIGIAYDLPAASLASGLSQYELITGLSDRFERIWTG